MAERVGQHLGNYRIAMATIERMSSLVPATLRVLSAAQNGATVS